MVDYAAANQAVIQEQIAKHLGLATILNIENHHNFAWQEEHEIDDVRRLVVARAAALAEQGRPTVVDRHVMIPTAISRT